MKHIIDLEQESKNREHIESVFPWVKESDIRTYSSPDLAVAEAILGIAKMQPHKNEVLMQLGQSPYLQAVPAALSKQGLRVKDIRDLKVEDVDFSSVLMTVVCQDHALSGEILNQEEWVTKAVASKSFLLRLHHLDFLMESFQAHRDPYAIDIYAYDYTFAFTAFGSRSKKILPLSSNNSFAVDNLKLGEEKSELVRKLEKEIAALGGKVSLYFKQDQERVFDRLLFKVEGKNGEWLLSQLSQTGLTTSPCFWQHPYQLSWWSNLKDDEQWIILPITQDFDSLLPTLSSLV